MPEAKPSPFVRLLSAAPPDLRWAADVLSGMEDREHRTLGASLPELADRIEVAVKGGDSESYRHLLAEMAPMLRQAAEVLRATDDGTRRHRANNLLQSSGNADYLLDRTKPVAA